MEGLEQDTLRSALKHFMEKARHAIDAANFQSAGTALNIASKIIEELQLSGFPVPGEEADALDRLRNEVIEAAGRHDREVKGNTVSRFKELRERGEVLESGGKKPKVLSVFLFGLDAAGKTTFVDYINNDRFIDHSPTIGVDISRITLGSVKFVFNDVGGQVKYRENWRGYWRRPDAMVFMIDASDAGRVDQARAYLWDVVSDPSSAGIPLAVLVNKMDKPDIMSFPRVVDHLDLKKVKHDGRLVAMFDTSLKTSKNVDKAMTFLASTALGDADLRRFVDAEVARINKNLKELFKAYVQEARHLEKDGNWQVAMERVTRARLVQEELFKQGFSRAAKEIDTCTRWLSRLQRASGSPR